jgi:hypothetical protein
MDSCLIIMPAREHPRMDENAGDINQLRFTDSRLNLAGMTTREQTSDVQREV